MFYILVEILLSSSQMQMEIEHAKYNQAQSQNREYGLRYIY